MGCIVKNEGTVYSDTTGWELLGDGYLVLVETFCNIVQNNFHLKIPRNKDKKRQQYRAYYFFLLK